MPVSGGEAVSLLGYPNFPERSILPLSMMCQRDGTDPAHWAGAETGRCGSHPLGWLNDGTLGGSRDGLQNVFLGLQV